MDLETARAQLTHLFARWEELAALKAAVAGG
jgi:hypothetical protein